MGPITLFDKSFLQSLSLDESVWFGHYFMPVICPLFYVETLADLEKAAKEGRTPEQEVGAIASKFPEMSGTPCAHHRNLVLGDLQGYAVPMTGQIPMSGGRTVIQDSKYGVLFGKSKEAEAFARWQRREFLLVERGIAKEWRAALETIDLEGVAEGMRKLGVNSSNCRSLSDAHALATAAVRKPNNLFPSIAILAAAVGIPPQYHEPLIERWIVRGPQRPLSEHAPYAAHVLTVEMFFQIALAARLIGTQRASNRVDIAYLNYLPFCHLFTSSDALHRKCAPLFLRPDQEFVWGPDFKADFSRINAHFMSLPEEERDRGIGVFAHAPPKLDGSVVRQLRAKFLSATYDDGPYIEPPKKGDPRHAEIFKDAEKWKDAPTAPPGSEPRDDERLEMLQIERRIRHKKGSWWQLGKDFKKET